MFFISIFHNIIIYQIFKDHHISTFSYFLWFSGAIALKNLSCTQNLEKKFFTLPLYLYIKTKLAVPTPNYFSLFFWFLPIFHILGLRTSILYKEIWEVSSNPETDPPNRIKTYFEHFSTIKKLWPKTFFNHFQEKLYYLEFILKYFFQL